MAGSLRFSGLVFLMEMIMKFKKKDLFTNIYYLQEPSNILLERANDILHKRDSIDDAYLLKHKITKKRARCVYLMELDEKKYYIKKFSNRSFPYIVRDMLRPQRGVRSLFTYSLLTKRDIPAAEMTFAMVDRRNPFNRPSLVVSSECCGKTIKEILKQPISKIEKDLLLNSWIEFMGKMIKKGVYHHDPNLSNFIRTESGLALIDIDDVYVLPVITRRIFNQMMIKLNRILLLAQIRAKNGNLDLDNRDREMILKGITRRYDSSINLNKFFLFLERNSKLKSLEITSFINDLRLNKEINALDYSANQANNSLNRYQD